jgi:hypothetical protein
MLSTRCLECLQIIDMFNPEFFVGTYQLTDGTWEPAGMLVSSVSGAKSQLCRFRVDKKPRLIYYLHHPVRFSPTQQLSPLCPADLAAHH